MKYLLCLFVFLFAISACENTEQFASLKNGEDQLASESPQYKQDLKSIASHEVESKISGKKRKNIKIEDTVGEKNLDKGTNVTTEQTVTEVEKTATESEKTVTTEQTVTEVEKPVTESEQATTEAEKTVTTKQTVTTTNIKVVDVTVKKAVQEQEEENADVKKELVVSGKETSDSEKKLDILFYMHNRKSKCIQNIRSFSKKRGFLEHLNHLAWQMSFSYYSQTNGFLPLELYNGQAHNTQPGFSGLFNPKADYILSKGEYSSKKRDRLFSTTLQIVYPDYENKSTHMRSSVDQLNSNGNILDPLIGLDQLLDSKSEGFVRSDSHIIILFFGYDFPYYSPEEWRTFFKKHKDVSVIALSSRSANVSNLVHVLEKSEYDFDFLAACDTKDSSELLIETIKQKVQ